MASSVNPMPAASSTPASSVVTPAPAQSQGARSSLKPTVQSKAADGARRQSRSPMDSGQRRPNSQKAWTPAAPVTQKQTHSHQNGSTPHPKQSTSPKPLPKESNTSDNHAHDRLVFLLASFIGLLATVTTRNGDKFTGIFSSSMLETSESSFVLKMTQRISKQDLQRSNGVSDAASPFIGSGVDHAMAFDVKDVADISVLNASIADITAKGQNGASSGFRTDTDISGSLAARERALQRWEPAPDTVVDTSLESTAAASWDQFETNARLFGATSSYDENIYTTRIDRSDPAYKRKEAEAARIAREIEGTAAENPHVREERGLAPIDLCDQDEESKYSGVRRDEKASASLVSGQLDRYTPPARRQPTVHSATLVKQTDATPTDAYAHVVPIRPKEPRPAQVVQEKEAQHIETVAKIAAVEQNPSLERHTSSTAGSALRRAVAAENATANVETEVLDHFRQFANNEKLKMQERRRNQASYDRTVKLNELMKFSHSFKLATPVPKDLIPILAKDPHKQEEIIHKAQNQAEEKVPSGATPVTAEQKVPIRGPGPARYDNGIIPSPLQSDRQNQPRRGQIYPSMSMQPGSGGLSPSQTAHAGRGGTGTLSHRLADNLQQRKGAAVGSVPTPLPIHDTRMLPTGSVGDQSGVSSPVKAQTPLQASSTKFNAKATEFKPNPAASAFTPGASAISSPQPSFRGRTFSRATSPSFFGAKKLRPIAERPSIVDQFNPIKRMKEEGGEKAEKDYSFNGGIPPAYKTLPTWDVAPGNEDKTYQQLFKPLIQIPPGPHKNRPASSSQAPPSHAIPYQFQQPSQGMPPVSGPPHGPYPAHPHQHHGSGPHFDDHRMQIPASTPQVFPSPRLQQSHIGYPSPMAPHAQLTFNQPMPQFYMGQAGPQPAHMRHYPNAPQFTGSQASMGAPMMIQQPSGSYYMGGPQSMSPYASQVQVYSPNPGHAYPAPLPQAHSGYPSPSRGAPMMMHQSSQPGQSPQPVMFMNPAQHGQPVYPAQHPGHMGPARNSYPQQPHFSSSPHQGHHFAFHQHRTPSNNYTQAVSQMAPQGPPPANSTTRPAEGLDEVK